MSFFHAARTRLRLLLARRDAESRMHEEFRFHVDMEAERLVRDEGLDPVEARRRAIVAFGEVHDHKDEMRAGRGPMLPRGYGLDLKLALRMMRKHPGLSVIAVLGMAVAIAIGAGAFGLIDSLVDPTVPLHEGDRIVAIQNSDARHPGDPQMQVVHDFARWRTRLTKVRDVGAWGGDSRTLVLPDGSADLVRLAHMSAAGFRVARVAPLMGRPLVEADERDDAPPVLVISEEQWRRRFGADPGIVGRRVKLGRDEHTIVGVMPAGFRFPIYHQYWTPLRVDPVDYAPGTGPALRVFGRLAPGATMEEAQAELSALGLADPAAPAQIQPRVLPYTHPFAELDNPSAALAMRALQLAISLLLVLVAVNVAVLVYARTASRAGEIAIRNALGATRRRVVGQLFLEALVMCALAAALGLTTVRAALALAMRMHERAGDHASFPFWIDFSITPGIVLYTVAAALLASVIVGVLPALRATGREVQAQLQRFSGRGAQLQLGRTWTTLIVAQVAIAVAVLPYAGYVSWQALRRGSATALYPIEQIIRAEVTMEGADVSRAPDPAADSVAAVVFRQRAAELERRLEAEPGVAGVTYASSFPGQESYARVEAEGGGTRDAKRSRVDAGMFADFGLRPVAGRALRREDVRDVAERVITGADTLGEESGVAVVNPALATWLRSTGAVLGRHIRQVVEVPDGADGRRTVPGPWIEVVGVMPEFTVQSNFNPLNATFYTPASLAQVTGRQSPWGPSVSLAVRMRGTGAASFAPRFRAVAAAVDPALQLNDLRTVADIHYEEQQSMWLVGLAIAITTASVLLLSAAGIYAMMSFTVTRRRREIGIRAALGADARRILTGVFSRAGAQLGAGVLGGIVVAKAADPLIGGGFITSDPALFSGERLLLLPLAGALMLVIGLLAALGPARRGLAVQPGEALREE